jgi:glycine dehydrogenase subunit 2
MTMIRARELGFDACMFMLHKTFGVAKGGGGPAVGAFGCTSELASHLPGPIVEKDGDRYVLADDSPSSIGRYVLADDSPSSIGRVREYLGNVQQVVKAYAWTRAMGAEGIAEASDISVLLNS